MTAIPCHKAIINFEDDFIKHSFFKTIESLNHKHLIPFLHLDVLQTQKLMIKIHPIKQLGSIKDLLYKTVVFF